MSRSVPSSICRTSSKVNDVLCKIDAEILQFICYGLEFKKWLALRICGQFCGSTSYLKVNFSYTASFQDGVEITLGIVWLLLFVFARYLWPWCFSPSPFRN